ncbi:hypothetical protein [Capnocytophaga granulosa]|nr:hypothetical protein [Capnocytophaga granulosa]
MAISAHPIIETAILLRENSTITTLIGGKNTVIPNRTANNKG